MNNLLRGIMYGLIAEFFACIGIAIIWIALDAWIR